MRHQHTEIIKTEGGYDFHVIGAPATPLRDLYHALLRVPWWATLLTIVGGYLTLNALFALLFMWVGGVANVQQGSFADAFFFSVQTMGTIGYGGMLPTTTAANVLVVAESVTGLIVTALATGLVFVRFSQTRARVMFSRQATVGPLDGVPTLMLRMGNERRGPIVDVLFRVTLTRTTRTSEGVAIYRSSDLPLVRARATALSRSWMVLHRIDAASPLHDDTPQTLAAGDVEITLEVAGIDDTSLQPVHARHIWYARDVVYGARLADVLSEEGDRVILDLRRFHEIEPTPATETFPYTAAR